MAANAQLLLDSMDSLPAMPAVAARVLGFSDDTASAAEVAHVLSGDPALTAALLKVANSAYYGFSRQLSTVREAVLLLGFKQVRQIAVGASLISSWSRTRGGADGFNLDLFWGHTLAVAMMSETGARKFNAGRPEEAFTAGMLHDIGVLALRKAMPEEFSAVMKLARQGQSLWDAEIETVGFTHAEVGGALAERWQLPARLGDAICRHHEALIFPGVDGLAGVVSFADRVADYHGIHAGFSRGPQLVTAARALPEELATLEIASGGIDAVVSRAHAFVTSVSGPPRDWFGAPLSVAA